MEPWITTEPSNKSQGREEDEGMWLNREAEIAGALHEAVLTGLLLQINGRNKQGRETKRPRGTQRAGHNKTALKAFTVKVKLSGGLAASESHL